VNEFIKCQKSKIESEVLGWWVARGRQRMLIENKMFQAVSGNECCEEVISLVDCWHYF